MVEVPARKLAGRDAARDGVGEPEGAVPAFAPGLEDRVVDHLVKQGGHVGEGEALEDRDRNPVGGVGQLPEGNAADGHNPELPRRVEQVAGRAARVQRLQFLVGNGFPEPILEGLDLLPIVVRLHAFDSSRGGVPGGNAAGHGANRGRPGPGLPRVAVAGGLLVDHPVVAVVAVPPALVPLVIAITVVPVAVGRARGRVRAPIAGLVTPPVAGLVVPAGTHPAVIAMVSVAVLAVVPETEALAPAPVLEAVLGAVLRAAVIAVAMGVAIAVSVVRAHHDPDPEAR